MTIRIGIAGIGFMGMVHYLTYRKLRGAKVVALCEQEPVRLSGDWRSIKGNFGPPGEMMDLGNVARYGKIEQLAADPNVDLVDVCLPPGLHAQATIAALRAGKHVFCEKPIALSAAEAVKMCAAAEKADRLLLIGHVLPFFPEYRFAIDAARSGKYGKLLGGHFKRVISDPQWLPRFYDPQHTGGPMLDLHVHDAHFIRLLFGMPKAVNTAGRMRGAVVEQFTTQFVFDDADLVVTASSGVIRQQGRPFTHAFEIYFERATLLYDFANLASGPVLAMPLTVLDERGRAVRPKLGGGDPMDAFRGELGEVIRAVGTGQTSPVLDGRLARDAVVLCHKQTESARKGKPVKVA